MELAGFGAPQIVDADELQIAAGQLKRHFAFLACRQLELAEALQFPHRPREARDRRQLDVDADAIGVTACARNEVFARVGNRLQMDIAAEIMVLPKRSVGTSAASGKMR